MLSFRQQAQHMSGDKGGENSGSCSQEIILMQQEERLLNRK